MYCKPDGLPLSIRPDHPVFHMRRYFQPVPRAHVYFAPILEQQTRSALQQQHKLGPVLVVPDFLGRGVAPGDDSFDLDVLVFDQGFEEFFWEFVRDIFE